MKNNNYHHTLEFILLEMIVNFPTFSPFVSTEKINSIVLLSLGFILVYN